ncbi:MAG: gliding motility-associated C-terminal domain-containing protein, partial [Bacteroidales bacterium]|nr:gliding motility-associated C-terminal domain-containing protein [Bacteroidales bacterium]MBN2818838.1 gliding motility-associated C-terminal domain-containing protein [Bacteroidales bacterium]
SVTDVAGITYTWTVPADWSITAGQGTSSITVDAGSASGTVEVTPSNGCGTGTASTLTVTTQAGAPTSAGVIAGEAGPCENTTGLTYSVTDVAGITYIWTVPADWSITAGQGTSSITIDAGTNSGTIEVTPSNGCGTGTLSTLTVTTQAGAPVSAGTIIGEAGPCENEPGLTYSVTEIAGISYNWTVPADWTIQSGQGTNSIVVKAGITSGSVEVTPSNGCGSGASSTLEVTIQSGTPAITETISGETGPCENTTGLTYSVSEVAGITYSWAVPSDWTIQSGQGTSEITVDAGTESGTIEVTPSNGCGTGNAETLTVTVQAGTPDDAGSITGSSSLCQGTTNVSYSVGAIANATNYVWTYSGTGATISGTGTDIKIDFDASATSGDLSVYGSNGCGDGSSSTLSITVNVGGPSITGVITGSGSVCAGSSDNPYVIDNVTNATGYTWSYSGIGAIITNFADSVSIDFGVNASSGELSVFASNGCGNSDTLKQTIAVSSGGPDVPALITGDNEVCQGETAVEYSIESVDGATSYTWAYSGSGTTINGSGTDITIDFSNTASSGNLLVYASNTCGQSDADTLAITVNTAAPATAGAITGDVEVCQGETAIEYSISEIAEATSYIWNYTGNGATINGSSNEISVDFGTSSSSGYLSVAGVNSCGTGDSSYISVDVVSAPQIINPGDIASCNSFILPAITGSNLTGQQAYYSEANGEGTQYAVSDEISSSMTIYIRDGSGICSSEVNFTITINEATVKFDEDEPVQICEGDEYTFSLSEVYESYSWNNSSTGNTYTVSEAGDVWVVVKDEDGCEASDTTSIIVNALPILDLGNDTVICSIDGYILDAGDFASYNWSTGSMSNSIVIYPGEQEISLQVTDYNGCNASDVINILECKSSVLGDITNVFTPNDDKKHDTWVINGIEQFPEAIIEVYDRWGRKVFQMNGGYGRANAWDGKRNGKALPLDNYYYIIDLYGDGTEILKGNITIVK